MRSSTKTVRPRPTTMESNEGSKKRSRGEGGKARKACPQGTSCPYQDEYQHNLEFSHDHNPKAMPNPRFGGTGNGQNNQPSVFETSGVRLGAGVGGNRLLEEFEQQLRDKQKHPAQLPPQRQHSTQGGSGTTNLAMICCNLCGLSMPKDEAKNHFLLHQLSSEDRWATASTTGTSSSSSSAGNSNNTIGKNAPIMIDITPDKTKQMRNDRLQQDVDYDHSVLEEIRQKSEADELEKMKIKKEKEEKEREAYKAAMKESKRLMELGEQQKAIMKLIPEPIAETYDGRIVAIRFRLPSGAKLIRKFRVKSCMQDAFDYLKTLPELVHSKYMLQSVVGAVTYKSPVSKTFEESSIVSNTTLIVVLLDDDDDEEGMLPLSNELSQVEIAQPSKSRNNNKRDRETDEEVLFIDAKKSKATRPAEDGVIDLT